MKNATFLSALALLSIALAGCSSGDATMTKQEEQDFKGKPRPAGAVEKAMSSAGGPKGAAPKEAAPKGP